MVSIEELLGSITTGDIDETSELIDAGDTTLEVLTAFNMFVRDAIWAVKAVTSFNSCTQATFFVGLILEVGHW